MATAVLGEPILTTEPVACRERDCIGEHDEDGGCIAANPCDPRCLGHYGKPIPCNPCPNPRCTGHDEKGHDLCGHMFCRGHEWSEEDEELSECDLPDHVPWCPGLDDPAYPCGTAGGCEIKFTTVTAKIDIDDQEFTAWFDDTDIDPQTMGQLITDLGTVKAMWEQFETLRLQVQTETEAASAESRANTERWWRQREAEDQAVADLIREIADRYRDSPELDGLPPQQRQTACDAIEMVDGVRAGGTVTRGAIIDLSQRARAVGLGERETPGTSTAEEPVVDLPSI